MSKTTFEICISLIIAFWLTAASYVMGFHYHWIHEISWLEAFSVFTSYSCTILCVLQVRFNYIIGAISTAALSLLFWRQGLYASAALNAYLAPALAYGWWRWGPDEETLPVGHVDLWSVPLYLAVSLVTWGILYKLSAALGGTMAPMDSFLLVGSILAQFLLDNKRIETWGVWAVVNVFSIYTYWHAGLVVVALQFVLFLANTVWGFVSWQKSMREVAYA